MKIPPYSGPEAFPLNKGLFSTVSYYEGTWQGRKEEENFAQEHERELAKDRPVGESKDTLRQEVRNKIEKAVDLSMVELLNNLTAELQKYKKGGGKKKGKGGVSLEQRVL